MRFFVVLMKEIQDFSAPRTQYIMGIDEAGRGPVIGPMVIAAVVFKRDVLDSLVRFGIKDSKKLTSKKREQLKNLIKKNCEFLKIEIIRPQQINEEMERATLNEIEINYFVKVMKEFIHLKNTSVYIDGIGPNLENTRNKILALLGSKKARKIIIEHKADEKFPTVGAASILAKTVRDEEIKFIKHVLNGEEIGSGYPSDKHTINFLTKYYKTRGKFPEFARTKWKTCEKIMSTIKNKRQQKTVSILKWKRN